MSIKGLWFALPIFVSGVLQAQTPVVTAVTGEDGPHFGLCPGGIAFIQGSNLGGSGASVMVAGKAAFVVNAFNGQLQVELPVDAPVGSTTLTVNGSAPFNVTLVQYAPGVATDGQQDNLVGAYHVASQAPVTAAFPATPGESIAVVATGLGPTNPPIPTGQAPADNSAVTVATPTVSVGGKAATVTASFLEPQNPGFYSVVFTVPASLTTGIQTISVSIGGQTSALANLPVSTGAIVGSVTNAASYNDPALPNGPIAQGSIFVVKGVNLGPSNLTVAPNAFQSSSLSGTSLSVTVGGATVAPLLYYTSSGQVAALLPSNTPTGTGTITATYNGQPGPSHPITVVANNIGIFTVSSDGLGAGIVTYPDYSLVSTSKAANCGGVNTTCGAANPGDTVIVWATGLGPVSGSDASGAGLGVDMTSVPLTIWLGGVQISAIYQGRSGCCVGEDQIAFTLPANAPTGCAVPLSLQIDSFVSNAVSIPIAPAGTRTCTPADTSFTTANVTQIGLNGAATYGGITLQRNDQIPGFIDRIKGQFIRFTVPTGMQPFFFTYVDLPPAGSCQLYNNTNGVNTPINIVAGLDAGSQINVQGPNGVKSIMGGSGTYNGTLAAGGNYLTPGAMSISGPGGADIPAFTTNFNLPAFPTLTSPQPDAANPTTVTRANGLTVTWTGGSSNSYVELDIYNNTDNSGTTGAGAVCIAPTSAGSFTIPPSVLLGLPTGNFNAGLDFRPSISPISLTGANLTASSLKAQYDSFTPLNFK